MRSGGEGGGDKERRIKLHCICSDMVCKCVLVMANQMVWRLITDIRRGRTGGGGGGGRGRGISMKW